MSGSGPGLAEVRIVGPESTSDSDQAIIKANLQVQPEQNGGYDELLRRLTTDLPEVAGKVVREEGNYRNARSFIKVLFTGDLQHGKSEFTEEHVENYHHFQFLVERLILKSLHLKNLSREDQLGGILRNLSGGEKSQDIKITGLMERVGRILYFLLGPYYMLQYQDNTDENKENRDSWEKLFSGQLKGDEYKHYHDCSNAMGQQNNGDEEGGDDLAWHLFIWAVLSRNIDTALVFLAECSCQMGAALIAFKILNSLSEEASKREQYGLKAELKEEALRFEDIAVETLENLYAIDPQAAYSQLVTGMTVKWAGHATPLSITQDAVAQRFFETECCHTFLRRLWLKYLDPGTSWIMITNYSLQNHPGTRTFLFHLARLINVLLWVTTPFVFVAFLFSCLIKECDDKDRKQIYGDLEQEQSDRTKTDDKTTKGEGSTTQNKDQRLDIECVCRPKSKTSMSKVEPVNEKQPPKHGNDRSTWEKTKDFYDGNDRSTWEKIKDFYTTPAVIFTIHGYFQGGFLLLYAYFLLSELRPVSLVSEVGRIEWLLIVWLLGFNILEFTQIYYIYRNILTNQDTLFMKPAADGNVWSPLHTIYFNLRLFILSLWSADMWNKWDIISNMGMGVCIVFRFMLHQVEFYAVRILYCGNFLCYCIRILRFAYISKHMGAWMRTIYKMVVKDMSRFLFFMSVAVISFGVVFQALLNPNSELSFTLLGDIFWRPYWQLYGEIFLDEYRNASGTTDTRTCTRDRSMAYADPSTYRLCHDYILLLFLALYLLITNILLINLLIAIFSHSFEKVQSNSKRLWRYDFYSLREEYDHIPWLPPPLNIPWVLFMVARRCLTNPPRERSLIWKKRVQIFQNKENEAFKRAKEDDEQRRKIEEMGEKPEIPNSQKRMEKMIEKIVENIDRLNEQNLNKLK